MNGTKVSRENSQSPWTYSPLKYWPNNEGDYLNFYGYTSVPESFDWDKKHESFTYTLPSAAGDQQDLIFSQALGQTKQSVNGSVNLHFYHALSAVLFKIGTLPEDISLNEMTVTLKNVKSKGTCKITNTENALSFSWDTKDNGTADYSQTFNSDEAYANGNDLSTIDKETAFMMIPHTFDEDASMDISFKIGNVEYRFDHPLVTGDNEEWKPNTKYTYILTIHEYVEVEVKETFTQGSSVKENVKFKNTGLTNAYMRAAIVGYWVNETGDIVASWDANDKNVGKYVGLTDNTTWIEGDDGFYYHKDKVTPGDYTSPLFTSYTLTGNPPIVGASLELNIVVQAVQSVPEVWSVTVSNGVLTSKQ